MVEFDPNRLIKSQEERIIKNERLGDFKYSPLTAMEVISINSSFNSDTTAEEYAARLAWRMFNKSYPSITWEKFNEMGVDGSTIVSLILQDVDFRGSSSETP